MKTSFQLDEISVTVYSTPSPQILFLQPVDEHDGSLLDSETGAMRDCALPFALAAFQVKDWNRDLSPCEAPPVFGKVLFDGGAEETLRFITDRLLTEHTVTLEWNPGNHFRASDLRTAKAFLWLARPIQ